LVLYNCVGCICALVFVRSKQIHREGATCRAMSISAVHPPPVNGASVVSADVLREAEFLQHLLQIRDQVFASKHPRIHLPSKVIEQVAPRLPPTPVSRPSTNGTTNGSASHSFPPRSGSSLQQPAPPIQPTQRPYSAASSSSIDPILLTKSDHLIKAELQLKRQQIERQLKDQFDKKGRGNDTEEREAHINVEECLIQAQLRVQPVSGLRSTTNNSDGVESFDENSYYSSKADSWSSEEVDPNQNTAADALARLTTQAKQSAKNTSSQLRPVEPTVIDLDEEAYEPADDIEIYEPDSALLHEDIEEEDYSPPPADVGPSESIRGRARDRAFGNNSGTNGYDFVTFLSCYTPDVCHISRKPSDHPGNLMHILATDAIPRLVLRFQLQNFLRSTEPQLPYRFDASLARHRLLHALHRSYSCSSMTII